MPRPSQPLIRRDAAVAAALQIIDAEGLDAFSLPRLARELGVRAPSLYHHFADRAEIMEEIARAIVRETVIPRKPAVENWPEWFVALAQNFRRVILRHSNAAPVLQQFLPRDILVGLYDDAAKYLAQVGVPHRLHVLILDGLEKLALGAAISEAMKDPVERANVFSHVDPEAEPVLARAVEANELSAAELFGEAVRTFLSGITASLPSAC